MTGEPVLSQRFEWDVRPDRPSNRLSGLPEHPHDPSWRDYGNPCWKTEARCGRSFVTYRKRIGPFFSKNGVMSLMVLPVRCGKDLWGCVGFSDRMHEREWSSNEQSILGAFAAAVGELSSGTGTRIACAGARSACAFRWRAHAASTTICDRDMNHTYISSPNFEEITGYSAQYVTSTHPPIATDNLRQRSGKSHGHGDSEEAVEPPAVPVRDHAPGPTALMLEGYGSAPC